MADDERRGRFGVSSDLLRLATDDAGAPTVPVPPDTRPPAASAGWVSQPVPALGDALRSIGAGRLILLETAGAVPLAVLLSVRGLAPHIERAVHVGAAGLEAVLIAAVLAGLACAPATGFVADRWGAMRAGVVAAGVGVVAGVLAGAAPTLPLLAVFVALIGVAAAAQVIGHVASLAGAAPPGARGRVLAVYVMWVLLLATGGAAVINVLASGADGWRWGMVVVSLVELPVAFALYRTAARPGSDSEAEDGAELGIGSTAQRTRRLRSIVGLLTAASALAFAAVGLPLLAAGDLQHHWHQAVGARGRIFLLVGLGAFGGVALAGWLGDRAWARGPRTLCGLVGVALAASGLLIAASAYLPNLGLEEVAGAFAVAALSVTLIAFAQAITAVAQPVARGVTLGLFGAYGLLFGGVGATVVLTAVSQADGARLALAMAGLCGVAAGAVVWGSAHRFAEDVTRTLLDSAPSEPLPDRPAGPRPARSVALGVRNIDFSYGTRQVLFGVGLEVAEGEVAALLGTNGAGKSTLLRLVAGLDHPSTGTIRLWGRDVTYLEAEQVVGLGVAMLPGGRMSFPGLSVLENLRVGGHTIRRQGPRLRTAIDEVLDLFPILAERRDQRVGTLSGGEQQMLALGRVLLTRPRLLLIDELSLGLAPKAVESLLAIVRRVNQEGTTVLLVEQSVNLALQLAGHAFFLERGEVRFDGDTAELLGRDDLLRPVFLNRDAGTR
ncbi:MAG TPA: MFS transporter [Acidimicrobiales bacterium]|nr:MFS transporter [Acidimicrobiales bacterium]